MNPCKSLAIALTTLIATSAADAQDVRPELGKTLSSTYNAWRNALVQKDFRVWQALTAPHRQMEVKNRILSEKRPFPGAVFQVPVPPPGLDGLKLVRLSQVGATAKGVWFGPVDFGVDGEPTDNLLALSFVQQGGRWLYDRADFVNLSELPAARKEMAEGDFHYVDEIPEAKASGQIPPVPMEVNRAKYIAKVYAFCPGREVNVQVNRISRHRFANTREAEIIMGGAVDGRNEITYSVKPMEGSTGKEAFALRVYLMSEIEGTKPVIAFERLAQEGEPVKGFETQTFNLDPETAKKLVP
ncbi:hypothetical protein HNR46_000088 [Haloferula luteola]|uniref:DUF1571 domain-containing protein n=1 Tax=Haloferula luteola TaxID=595692 RepID=A0A840UUJ5_9BACT|nr:hypothetical protein [Haloferula luteola]MBB5349867.1 hypothetical protein [Haloferula luteola]